VSAGKLADCLREALTGRKSQKHDSSVDLHALQKMTSRTHVLGLPCMMRSAKISLELQKAKQKHNQFITDTPGRLVIMPA
jgi:hypothetical protein